MSKFVPTKDIWNNQKDYLMLQADGDNNGLDEKILTVSSLNKILKERDINGKFVLLSQYIIEVPFREIEEDFISILIINKDTQPYRLYGHIHQYLFLGGQLPAKEPSSRDVIQAAAMTKEILKF